MFNLDNPLGTTFHSKILPKENIIKRIQLDWWLRKGNEQKVIDNLLLFLNKDTLPQKLNLKEVKKLIDYHIYNETRDYLEEALIHYQNNEQLGEILFLQARCCLGLGSLDGALKKIELALQLEPNNSDYWNLQADCLLELGEWEAAVTCFNKSLRSSPGNADTIYRLGSIFILHGEYGEALNCFSGCCKLKPFNHEYWEMKAEMLVKLDQISAACECFLKAAKYSGQIRLFSRLAYCYAKTGQVKKSKKLLLKVLKEEPDNYDALCNLAGIYHKLNKDEQAYKLLKKAYTLNKNDPLLLNNLGYICCRLGRSRKAVEYYNQALTLSPSDKIVLYNLGVCLYKKGIWEEARGLLEKLISIDSNNPDAWTLLGNVYEQLSKHKVAVDCFNRSLGLAK